MFFPQKAFAVGGSYLKHKGGTCCHGLQVGVVDNMLSLGVFSWCRMKHLKSPFNPAEMERTSMICCRTASTSETGESFFCV